MKWRKHSRRVVKRKFSSRQIEGREIWGQFYHRFTSNICTCRSQKRKKDWWLDCLFALLGSVWVKKNFWKEDWFISFLQKRTNHNIGKKCAQIFVSYSKSVITVGEQYIKGFFVWEKIKAFRPPNFCIYEKRGKKSFHFFWGLHVFLQSLNWFRDLSTCHFWVDCEKTCFWTWNQFPKSRLKQILDFIFKTRILATYRETRLKRKRYNEHL